MKKKAKRKPVKRKGKREAMPYATITMLALCAIAYLAVSGGEAYVYPLGNLDAYGVSLSNPAGALTYSFLHVGLKHLVGNLIVILAMGLVVERVLGWKDTLKIYLVSGIGAGLLYIFLYPNALVIGSSAAISGLILAGYVVDVKKAFIVLAAILLLVPAFVYPGVNAGLDWLTAQRTAQELQANAESQMAEQQLCAIRQQIEKGNATAETLALEYSLAQLAQQREEEYKEASGQRATIVVGRAREEATPVSFEIHVFGMVMAALYLAAFRRDAYSRFIADFRGIWGRMRGA